MADGEKINNVKCFPMYVVELDAKRLLEMGVLSQANPHEDEDGDTVLVLDGLSNVLLKMTEKIEALEEYLYLPDKVIH